MTTLKRWMLMTVMMLVCLEAARGGPGPATVPPTLEMVILDPNADPVGNPAIVPISKGNGRACIDIPESVVVHRFYYSGDRTFQGPFLKGGPTMVVASHPRFGERQYIPVQMYPGAPRVTYRSNSITYDFGEQGITVRFHDVLHHRPSVEYRNGKSVKAVAAEASHKAKEKTTALIERTGIPEVGRQFWETTKNVTITSIDRANDVGKMVLTPVQQAVRAIPGVNLLTSTPEDRALRAKEIENRKGQMDVQSSQFNKFIPAQ